MGVFSYFKRVLYAPAETEQNNGPKRSLPQDHSKFQGHPPQYKPSPIHLSPQDHSNFKDIPLV
jgi:hypothetical protein